MSYHCIVHSGGAEQQILPYAELLLAIALVPDFQHLLDAAERNAAPFPLISFCSILIRTFQYLLNETGKTEKEQAFSILIQPHTRNNNNSLLG